MIGYCVRHVNVRIFHLMRYVGWKYSKRVLFTNRRCRYGCVNHMTVQTYIWKKEISCCYCLKERVIIDFPLFFIHIYFIANQFFLMKVAEICRSQCKGPFNAMRIFVPESFVSESTTMWFPPLCRIFDAESNGPRRLRSTITIISHFKNYKPFWGFVVTPSRSTTWLLTCVQNTLSCSSS